MVMITMNEESWNRFEIGGKIATGINLRLAEVWAEISGAGNKLTQTDIYVSQKSQAKFIPNKQSLKDLNYRFQDSFISHIGKIKVVVSISGGLDFQSFQNKPGENILHFTIRSE